MKSVLSTEQKVFFELLKAGLWGTEVKLSEYGKINYPSIYNLAEEQSVVGLVTAGLEMVQDVKVPQEILLQFIGATLQIEQKNKAMNEFVAKLIEGLRKKDVYALLVKGQGIAQCYEKPLWRSSGDVDLLLSDTNYEKAKEVLIPLAVDVESEYKSLKHLGMTMRGDFVVELHGTLHSRLSRRMDKVIDEAQRDVFYSGHVRSWHNGNTQVFLPAADNDVIFVFTHILHHFFIEGVGLRQICDWCRLLWTYRDKLNKKLLEQRLRKAGIVSEWKAFYALATKYLGMPEVSGFMFQDSRQDKWEKKADKIMAFVLESGNFGHNRKQSSGKMGSFWGKTKDFVRHSTVFPWDSLKFYIHFLCNGVGLAVNKSK